MAYSQIAKPGTQFGPCKILRKCKHKDCQELWNTANEICALCDLEIGFERNFCSRLEGVESPRPYVHFACAQVWVETVTVEINQLTEPTETALVNQNFQPIH